MLFDQMEYELDARGRIVAERVVGEEFFPADDVILAIGQENAFPWIEDDLGLEFDKWHVPVVDKVTFQSTRPERVLRRRRGVRPEEHHLGRRARPPGGDLDPQFLHGPAGHEPAAADDEPVEPQDGPARVVVQERLQPGRAAAGAAREPEGALQAARHRGRARLRRRAGRGRGAALPQLRRADGVRGEALHRVRRLHRHLPDRLPDHHARTARKRSSRRASRRRARQPAPAALRLRSRSSRPAASWSRTRTSACTADSAPSAARRRPGTCRSPRIHLPHATDHTWPSPQKRKTA